jgi:hypothetical protein
MTALDGINHLAVFRLAHPVENAPLFPLLFSKRYFGQRNHSQNPCKIPMGKKMAPATKNPHSPAAKQVKMCVNHANIQATIKAIEINPVAASSICYSFELI